MIVPVGVLEHEVSGDASGDASAFDRQGYAVARAAFAPDVIRALRAPLIEAMTSDGHVEAADGELDRFRWIGGGPPIDMARYRSLMQEHVEERLLRSGLAARALHSAWGRRPAIWQRAALFVMPPGAPTRAHRDGWQKSGSGGPDEHGNFWCPLTCIGADDGPLAIAVGSHRIADEPPNVAMPYPIHPDFEGNTGNRPPPEVLAPMWRTTTFDVGDALMFRPDIVHSTSPNRGPFVRLAVVLCAQDAELPLPAGAGLSLDAARDLTDAEWLTLVLLTLQPSSPWLARCAFYSRGVIGRLWTEQPDDLVDRTFTTLQALELIEPHAPHDDDDASFHRYYSATSRGRLDACDWLTTPVSRDDHLLALKLLFCDWLGLDTAGLLVNPRMRDARRQVEQMA